MFAITINCFESITIMNHTSLKVLDGYLKQQDYQPAVDYCRQMEKGGNNDAYSEAIKGWCLYKLDQLKEAEDCLLKAFSQQASHLQVAQFVMSFYMDLARYQEVVSIGQICVGLHSNDRLMWHRLATAHFLLGDLQGAVIAFRRSLKVELHSASAFGLSQPLLCQGNYQEGLELYEHRFAVRPVLNWIQCEKMPMPQWLGEPIEGKTLLVWSEQGLGDSIQFSRIITQLTDRGAKVDLMLQAQHASLQELLGSIDGIGEVSVVRDKQVTLKRRYDYHCPLMSLMKNVGLTPENIFTKRFPYLTVSEPIKSEHQTEGLMRCIKSIDATKVKVGIVWSTALTDDFRKRDAMHYALKDKKGLQPQDIVPVLKMDGLHFFSLHIAKPQAVQSVIDQHDVIDLSPYIKDFTDTAVMIEEMDLVISIDTSVAHLAGAMAKPVLNLLPYAADWRWQMHREDSPWYPSMRLLRQTQLDDWSSVIKRLKQILPRIAKQHQNKQAINVFV